MSFIAELQRRNVVKAALLYVVAAWLILQVADLLFGALDLPPWSLRFVLGLLVLGLPLVLIFSWVYELTPEGLRREHEIDRNQSITRETGRKINLLIVVLLAAAVAMPFVTRMFPRTTEVPAAVAPATSEGATVAVEADPGAATDAASIAVLPFVNMSGDADNEYFYDGLSEELLNVLAQIPDLRVIARTSSFAFKGKDTDIATVAAKLAVAHVLEGSVRKAGNRVRITAQLIRAADSSHLWSQSYDRGLEDVFAVQEEIAREVAGQLKLKLLPGAGIDASIGGTTNPRAHDLYLRLAGRAMPSDGDGFRRRLAEIDEVLALDDGYARAHVLHADTLRWAVGFGFLAPAEGYASAKVALARAIGVSPGLADAYAARADLHMFELDWRKAEPDLARALALNPGSALVQRTLATARQGQGRVEEGLQAARVALSLDPLSGRTRSHLGTALKWTRRFDEAETVLSALAADEPAYPTVHAELGEIALLRGDPVAALAAFDAEAMDWARHTGRAIALDALGRHDESERALQALLATVDPDWSSYQQAVIHAQRGNLDGAFAALETGLRVGDPGLALIKIDFMLEPLRKDPRYTQLIERMYFAP